ncbi:G2 and S phase-expressed protein 1 [Ictalurus punctatus]|uniref:G2 and S phase-expressed protein 1 n=1 Tax=Ictalurus punctatus TaxID=7998 RepID=A0A2D0RJJ7_ICTPU|nr:G2 and S phase-expressed protein 1 [Ictalurus punctatus]XP_017330692.1 G2 and S phase-expressed protein 1 [Ictalurus punctatus]
MMASIADDDFCSLAEEKFDFEVSLSPASSKGEDDVEDEVFLGPVTHKERSISHGVETHMKDSMSSGPSLGEEPSWSPLLEENFEEIHKEAHLLVSHLERTLTEPVAKDLTAASSLPEGAEKFEMDSSAKLVMFKPADTLSPIKRETFCIQDSPMRQLPPAIQKRLQKSSTMSGGIPRLSTSSPVRTTDTQPKMATRGKSLVPSGRVLSNKPTAMGNSRLSSGTRPALPSKNRLPPPSKSCFGLKRSPGSRDASRTGSAEDLLSDTTSVASDMSDSSFNTSLPVKRALPAPSKTELRGGAPLRKVPTLPNKRVVDRSQNTSSSSSSVSSINSSLSVSPTGKCKLNSSLNTSVSSISGRIPSSGSRFPSSNCKSGIISKPLESSAGRTTSLSTQGRKGSEPVPRPIKATPIRRTETGLSVEHQTRAKKTMQRTTSVPSISTLSAKTGSTVKVNSNLKAFVSPSPTNTLKGVRGSEVTSSPDVPRIMKPKRLMSACSVDSVPQRLVLPTSHGLQTPSSVSENPFQSKLRRPSALPTPVSRRVSGIPMLTPKSVPRLNKSSHTPEPQSPIFSSGISHASPGQLKQSEQQEVVEKAEPKEDSYPLVELQPHSLVFILEDDFNGPTACEPAAVKSSKPSPDDPEPHPTNSECPSFSKSEEILHNPQLKKTETQEVLLVDAPAPVLKPEEKVLIDLSNTPDLIKTIPSKGFGGQLIDLSSPLIKWSPDGKNEAVNEASPLINLSF